MTEPRSSAPRSQTVPGTMKWYGWGAEGESFKPADRPYLWSYAKRHLGMSSDQPRRRPVPLASIELPRATQNTDFLDEVAALISPERISTHNHDRLLHAYGKSTRDLWRIRNGSIDFAPDCVVFPESEDEVCSILKAARRNKVIIIPFGGGSNVAGCVELHRPDRRMVAVTINLRLMSRVLGVDKISRIAPAYNPDFSVPLPGGGTKRRGIDARTFPRLFQLLDCRWLGGVAIFGNDERSIRQR